MYWWNIQLCTKLLNCQPIEGQGIQCGKYQHQQMCLTRNSQVHRERCTILKLGQHTGGQNPYNLISISRQHYLNRNQLNNFLLLRMYHQQRLRKVLEEYENKLLYNALNAGDHDTNHFECMHFHINLLNCLHNNLGLMDRPAHTFLLKDHHNILQMHHCNMLAHNAWKQDLQIQYNQQLPHIYCLFHEQKVHHHNLLTGQHMFLYSYQPIQTNKQSHTIFQQ